MSLQEKIKQIEPVDEYAGKLAKKRWDSIAKPLGSLGLLEEAVIQMAKIYRTPNVEIQKRAVLIFCADNGVVCEGVTQCDSNVTAIVSSNFLKGDTSVCKMANVANADVIPVDIGINTDIPDMISVKTRYGTGNISKEPAMTRQEALQAVESGIEMVNKLSQQGYRIIATGEMGIGNTTTSSAVACALTNHDVEIMTGRGAGLSTDGLHKKQEAIRRALSLHQPNSKDVVDVLSKVGGLDLAGLTGAFIGGAIYHIPMLVDGFISAVAALCAVRMCPNVQGYILASHQSEEPACKFVLDELKLTPFLHASMRLGEGTGAVAAIPILDMAMAVYDKMSTFHEVEIEAYQPLI